MNLKLKKLILLTSCLFSVIAMSSCDSEDYKERYDSYVTNLDENLTSFEKNILQENQDNEVAINTSILEKHLHSVDVYTSNFDKQHKDLIKEAIDELNNDLNDVGEDFFTFNLNLEHNYYSTSKTVENILITNDRTSTINKNIDQVDPSNVTRSESTSNYDLMNGQCGLCLNSKITMYTTNIYELHKTVGKGFETLSYYCNACGESSTADHVGESCTHSTTTYCSGTIKKYTDSSTSSYYVCSSCGATYSYNVGSCSRKISSSYYSCNSCGKIYSSAGTCTASKTTYTYCKGKLFFTTTEGIGSGNTTYVCTTCGARYSSKPTTCGARTATTTTCGGSITRKSSSYTCGGSLSRRTSYSSYDYYKCSVCGREGKSSENGNSCGKSSTTKCTGTIVKEISNSGSGNFEGKYAIHFKSTLKRELMKVFGLKDYNGGDKSRNFYSHRICRGNITWTTLSCNGEQKFYPSFYKCIHCSNGYLYEPTRCSKCNNSGCFYKTSGYLCTTCNQTDIKAGKCSKTTSTYICNNCDYDYGHNYNGSPVCMKEVYLEAKTLMDIYSYQRNNGLTDFDKELLRKIYLDESLFEDNTFIDLNDADHINNFISKNSVVTSYLNKPKNWLGQEKYLRYYKRKKHSVYFAYDSTINSNEYKSILLLAKYLNTIFNGINTNFKFKVKNINEVSKINADNIVKITKNDTACSTNTPWWGYLTYNRTSYDDNYRLKDATITIRKTFFNNYLDNIKNKDNCLNDYILSVYKTLLQESGHLFGLGNASKLLDDETVKDYSLKKLTIMGNTGDVQNLGFGTNDYKLICALYGDYDENSYLKYLSNFRTFDNSGEQVYEYIAKTYYEKSFEGLSED